MFDLPKKEEEILRFWKEKNIFERSLEGRRKRKRFIFYEGPPYANGRPGIHHVVARCFKDIVLRYKTMIGFYVKRKAGWDTHGLPAEIAAEKALSIKSKKEIEKIGVEKFIQICKENVFTYKKEWESFTERIGYWLDMDNPYITCSNEYIESLFFLIKKFYERGFLYKENKVVPWCPRCQTTLAQHEIAQGYQKVKENSIYVKIKIKHQKKSLRGDILRKTNIKNYLLVWTTTPWTLPGNVAIAFNPKIDYVMARQKGNKENYVLAKERLEKVFGKGNYEILKSLKKDDILNFKYDSLFKQKLDSQYKDKIWRIYSADFVSADEGTGFVHIAPAFGEDDFNLGKENNLPFLVTVNEEGKMKKGVIGEGKFVKDADKNIIKELKRRKLLFREEMYEHDYPFCWRCDTPVLYYLHSSWFIATKKIKKKLIENNKKVKWYPEYFKEGRFGKFLEEVRDWNFSRERYWGTPLPVWECQKCKNVEVIGSRGDILNKSFSSNKYFLLRHGLAETNIKKILSSDYRKKYSLTNKGIKQIIAAAKKLKKLLKEEKIDIIFSSDILRCKESANIIKRELKFKGKIILRKELREIDLGEWEGRSIDELKKYLSKNLEGYLSDGLKGGESWNDFKRRVLKFIEEVEKKYQGKNILIISHGDILWSLDSAMRGLNNNEILDSIKNKKGHFEKGEIREIQYKKFPFNESGELDFHRPYIDKIIFKCEKCGGKMKRVKEVCDVWFDSGAMPFAQDYWPFNGNLKQKTRKEKLNPPEFFPADFICEGIDQTRGWFYTLLAVSSLLGFSSPYKRVLSTGLVMDKWGKKMSKSRGNVVNPWEIIEKYGSDSLRWYFYTTNSPWDTKRFDENDLKKCFNRFVLTFWNCFVFYETYKVKATFNAKKSRVNAKSFLNKWIILRFQSLAFKTRNYLEKYEIVKAAREIENFIVDDFSNWYIRRSREKFQKPKNKRDLKESSQTLGFILFELSKLLAPFIPFLSELIYMGIKKDKNSSVHFEEYPRFEKRKITKLEQDMDFVREIVSLALAQRKMAGIKVRQPLALLQIPNSKSKISKELLNLIREEVNVKKIIIGKTLKLDTKITKKLKEEGILRDIIRMIQDLRKRAGFRKENIIEISYQAGDRISKIIENNRKTICKETLSSNLFKKIKSKYIAEKKLEIAGEKIWIGIIK